MKHATFTYTEDSLHITGVTEVVSFDSDAFALIAYKKGNDIPLYIEGDNLKLKNLDMEKGTIVIAGDITKITFTEAY